VTVTVSGRPGNLISPQVLTEAKKGKHVVFWIYNYFLLIKLVSLVIAVKG